MKSASEWNQDGTWNYNWLYPAQESSMVVIDKKELADLKQALTDMTEARDAVAAGAKFLRDKCDMQADVLKMIAQYGTANPTWAVKLAKAMVEGNG